MKLTAKEVIKAIKDSGLTAYKIAEGLNGELTELLSMEDAARMANHNDIKMVRNVYAVGEKDRQIERLKRVGNEL